MGKKMRNLKLVLAYEGTNYHGFQIQAGTKLPTIQGVLEKALLVLTKEKIRVTGAGRTDAGVHARGQVVNFHSYTKIPLDKIPLALNTLLPRDVAVLKATEVPPDFHASFQSSRKTYQYIIYNDRLRDPFWERYSYHVPLPLKNVAAMQEACRVFVGEHDFRAFCARDTVAKSFRRTIYQCTAEKERKIIKLTISGDGFLYNMVRIITGTLLEVGQGKRKMADLAVLFALGDRCLAGPTVPPQGLCFLSVEYN